MKNIMERSKVCIALVMSCLLGLGNVVCFAAEGQESAAKPPQNEKTDIVSNVTEPPDATEFPEFAEGDEAENLEHSTENTAVLAAEDFAVTEVTPLDTAGNPAAVMENSMRIVLSAAAEESSVKNAIQIIDDKGIDMTAYFLATLSNDGKEITLTADPILHRAGKTEAYILCIGTELTSVSGETLSEEYRKGFGIGERRRRYLLYENFEGTTFDEAFDYITGSIKAYRMDEGTYMLEKSCEDEANPSTSFCMGYSDGKDISVTYLKFHEGETISTGKLFIEYDYKQTGYQEAVRLYHNLENYWTQYYTVLESNESATGEIRYNKSAVSWSDGLVTGSADTLKINQWQHVKMEVDIDGKTITYIIGDKVLHADYTDKSDFQYFRGLMLARRNKTEGSIVQYDNVEVYTVDESVTTISNVVFLDTTNGITTKYGDAVISDKTDVIRIQFSRPIDEATVDKSKFHLTANDGTTVEFENVKKVNEYTYDIELKDPLSNDMRYFLLANDGILDENGSAVRCDAVEFFSGTIQMQSNNILFEEDFENTDVEITASGTRLAGYFNGIHSFADGKPRYVLYDTGETKYGNALKIESRSAGCMHRHLFKQNINGGRIVISFDYYANKGDICLDLLPETYNTREDFKMFFTNHEVGKGNIYYSPVANNWPVNDSNLIGLEPKLVNVWQHMDIIVDLDAKTYTYIRSIGDKKEAEKIKSFDYSDSSYWNGTICGLGFGVPVARENEEYGFATTMFDNIKVWIPEAELSDVKIENYDGSFNQTDEASASSVAAQICFSNPMNAATLRRAFSLVNNTTGKSRNLDEAYVIGDGRTIRVEFGRELLEPNSEYTLTIDGKLKDAYGSRIPHSYEYHFSTGQGSFAVIDLETVKGEDVVEVTATVVHTDGISRNALLAFTAEEGKALRDLKFCKVGFENKGMYQVTQKFDLDTVSYDSIHGYLWNDTTLAPITSCSVEE